MFEGSSVIGSCLFNIERSLKAFSSFLVHLFMSTDWVVGVRTANNKSVTIYGTSAGRLWYFMILYFSPFNVTPSYTSSLNVFAIFRIKIFYVSPFHWVKSSSFEKFGTVSCLSRSILQMWCFLSAKRLNIRNQPTEVKPVMNHLRIVFLFTEAGSYSKMLNSSSTSIESSYLSLARR